MPLPYFSTCLHLVVTHVGTEFGRAVSPYTSTCRFVIVPCVIFLFVNVSFFHIATCAFLAGTCGVDVANFYLASCRLDVPIGDIFLLDHMSSLRVVSGIYVSVPYWTINFLLDHASVSCSRECPFRTATCPKPLHVDVHADPFHNRTNEMTFLFREISVIILTKQTTIKKVTTK